MRKRNGNGIRITENLKQGQQRHWCWRGKEWSPDPALVPAALTYAHIKKKDWFTVYCLNSDELKKGS